MAGKRFSRRRATKRPPCPAGAPSASLRSPPVWDTTAAGRSAGTGAWSAGSSRRSPGRGAPTRWS